MFSKILALVTVVCVTAAPHADDKQTLETAIRLMGKDCVKGLFSPTCLKIGILALLERANNKDQVTLLPGLSLVKDASDTGKAEEVAAELTKTLSSNPDEKLDKFLLYRLGTFLDTHSVKLRLLDDATAEEAKSMLGEARARNPFKMGKKGGMNGMMTMAMMMKGTLMSIGLGGLAMLAGKALMTAMMSLLLSAIIGIKSLTSGGKSTTYEIVSKPVYSHSHSHSTAHEDVGGGYGHSGYGRNLNVRKR